MFIPNSLFVQTFNSYSQILFILLHLLVIDGNGDYQIFGSRFRGSYIYFVLIVSNGQRVKKKCVHRCITFYPTRKLKRHITISIKKQLGTGHCEPSSVGRAFLLSSGDLWICLLKLYIRFIGLTMCKAFDCILLDEVKQKLFRFGLRENALKIIESYLGGRRQFVGDRDLRSSFLETKNGIPQGSVLGPVIFITYIADLSVF